MRTTKNRTLFGIAIIAALSAGSLASPAYAVTDSGLVAVGTSPGGTTDDSAITARPDVLRHTQSRTAFDAIVSAGHPADLLVDPDDGTVLAAIELP